MNRWIISATFLLSVCLCVFAVDIPTIYVTPVGCDTDDAACVPPVNKTLLNLLYVFGLDPNDGSMKRIQEIDVKVAPLWVAIHPNQKWVYVVSADNDPNKNGSIHSFAIDEISGRLTLINRVSSQGIAPVHISFDSTGKYLFTVNYVTGCVVVFRLKEGGGVGMSSDVLQHYGHSVDPDRQLSPHPHSINPYRVKKQGDRTIQFVYVPDLGLDRVYQYVFNPKTGKLKNNTLPFYEAPPGSGPRHMAFNPNNVYLLSEMAGTITTMTFDDETGLIKPTQIISTLPTNFSGFNKAAEVYLHSTTTGLSLYASNRGPTTNTIVQYNVDTKNGKLSVAEWFPTGVSFPRHFKIIKSEMDKDLMMIEGQDSHNISPFHIDSTTGSLTRTSAKNTNVATPACIAVLYPKKSEISK